jgi:hypothetical protein
MADDDSVVMSNAEFQQMNSTLLMLKQDRYEAAEREENLKKGMRLRGRHNFAFYSHSIDGRPSRTAF